MMVDTATP